MSGRHEPRPTRPTGVRHVNGWRLKTYEITVDGHQITSDILDAVGRVLTDAIPETTEGLGFVVLHSGVDQVWLLADLWRDDIVSQHTFFADLHDPTAFRRVPAGGPTACVWELAVHGHERDAYVNHVLDPMDGPDANGYLSDTLTIDVEPSRQPM